MQDVVQHDTILYPEYLYHYTTVESLAMILQSQSIRLAPLSGMDDIQESKDLEKKNFARFVFVSSWTEDSDESIPMWSMYAKMERGVRIKLPSMLIKEYDFRTDAVGPLFGAQVTVPQNVGFKLIFPPRELFSMPYLPIPYTKNHLLYKVKYIPTMHEPQVIVKNEDGTVTFAVGNLGIHKNTSWEFQKEWRFKVWISPMGFQEMWKNKGDFDKIAVQRMMSVSLPSPIDCIYLAIDDIAFSQMEITLNPKISNGNRIIVELLKKEFNPKMKISESILVNTIR